MIPLVNFWAVVVGALAAFVASTVYYIVFAKQRAELSHAKQGDMRRPQPGKMALELGRNLIVALVIAHLAARLGVTMLGEGAGLALLLWVGFPVILLWGSVMWEDVPRKLAAIHAGDWLIKLVILCSIVSMWR